MRSGDAVTAGQVLVRLDDRAPRERLRRRGHVDGAQRQTEAGEREARRHQQRADLCDDAVGPLRPALGREHEDGFTERRPADADAHRVRRDGDRDRGDLGVGQGDDREGDGDEGEDRRPGLTHEQEQATEHALS